MNVYGLSEAEFDLLADFTAGALDPEEHDRVARLIGTDERWAVAHDALLDADRAVRSDLRTIAGPIAVPADVAARLDETIAGLRDQSRRSPFRPVPSRTRRSQPSRWRRAGLAVVGAAAAAVVLVWGVSAVVSGVPQRQTTGLAQSGPGDVNAEQAPAAPVLPGGPTTIRSGRDYQPGTLGQLAQGNRGAAAAPNPAPAAGPGGGAVKATTNDTAPSAGGPGSSQDLTSDPLARLADPEALRACLAAVNQTRPGTPVVVDFARYQGAPALVVVVAQPSDELAVVVGPACGQGGSHELYTAPIGP